MLLKFLVQDNALILSNSQVLEDYSTIGFIHCAFNTRRYRKNSNEILIAVFKSASYNIKEEVVLDNTDACFIPGSVFEHGGVIQILLYKKDTDRDPATVSESTTVYELFIKPNSYVPMKTSEIWQAIANDVIDDIDAMMAIIDAGFSYDDLHDRPAIEGITLTGDQTYEELNLQRLSNSDIDELLRNTEV